MSQFDIDTKVTQTNDHIWSGTLSKSWNIGTNPNGGYLLSCVLSALKLALPHSDPITVTTHYLRPGTAGEPFEVHVSVIRTGRTLSTARASLIQAGKVRLEVLAGFGDLQVSAGIETTLTVPPPVIPPPDACIQRHGGTQGVELPIASRLDVRLHPALALAGQSQVAMIAGWIRFLDGREPDTGTLPLFTDTFPPSPFGLLGVIGWVPTIELTVQVRCRPAPGWIQAFPTERLSDVAGRTSTVNVSPGSTVANLAIVPIGRNGISLTGRFGNGVSSTNDPDADSSHVVVDAVGYITSAAAPTSAQGRYVPVGPSRAYDSRVSGGRIVDRQTLLIDASNAAGVSVPSAASGVLWNIAAVSAMRPPVDLRRVPT